MSNENLGGLSDRGSTAWADGRGGSARAASLGVVARGPVIRCQTLVRARGATLLNRFKGGDWREAGGAFEFHLVDEISHRV